MTDLYVMTDCKYDGHRNHDCFLRFIADPYEYFYLAAQIWLVFFLLLIFVALIAIS